MPCQFEAFADVSLPVGLADLLADPSWVREAKVLDVELARLGQPNDRLRLRFGEALAQLGCRYRDLGFRRLDLYVRERGSRSGRWGAESRRMAERLATRPMLRAALARGAISWSKAELVARYLEVADSDSGKDTVEVSEAELVALAETSSVRRLREVLAESGQAQTPLSPDTSSSSEGAEEESRVRLRRKVPAHQAMSLDLALSVIQHMSGGSKGDAVEWLLAEASTTVLSLSKPSGTFLEEVAERYRRRAEMRAKALAECENDEAVAEGDLCFERPTDYGEMDAGPLPDGLRALDAVVRQLGAQLASADHFRGWTIARFLAIKGWALLGYASDTQYSRERLGLSRSEMYRLAQLARRCERLPQVRDAVRSGRLGTSMAGLVVRVATPSTQEVWLHRASQRTFKHLKEEVDAVERVQCYVEGGERDALPPSPAEMALMHGLERDVLSGRALRRALGVVRPDLDGAPAASPVGSVRESFLQYEAVFAQATAFGVRSTVEEPDEEVTDVRIEEQEADSVQTSANSEGDPLDASAATRAKGTVWWSESVPAYAALHLHQLEEALRAAGITRDLLDLAIDDFFRTWAPALGRSDMWEHIYRNYRYRCTSPVCDSRNVTLHHITYRAHGGDDHDENLTTPCDFCHLDGEHGNRLRITPPASCPTFEIGNPPVLVVEGRTVVAGR